MTQALARTRWTARRSAASLLCAVSLAMHGCIAVAVVGKDSGVSGSTIDTPSGGAPTGGATGVGSGSGTGTGSGAGTGTGAGTASGTGAGTGAGTGTATGVATGTGAGTGAATGTGTGAGTGSGTGSGTGTGSGAGSGTGTGTGGTPDPCFGLAPGVGPLGGSFDGANIAYTGLNGSGERSFAIWGYGGGWLCAASCTGPVIADIWFGDPDCNSPIAWPVDAYAHTDGSICVSVPPGANPGDSGVCTVNTTTTDGNVIATWQRLN